VAFVPVTPEGSPYMAVFLGPLYFSTAGTLTFPGGQTIYEPATAGSQAEVLVHEFFHVEGFDTGGQETSAFDQWIRSDCSGPLQQ
jgi:hypothetical protein